MLAHCYDIASGSKGLSTTIRSVYSSVCVSGYDTASGSKGLSTEIRNNQNIADVLVLRYRKR